MQLVFILQFVENFELSSYQLLQTPYFITFRDINNSKLYVIIDRYEKKGFLKVTTSGPTKFQNLFI